MNEDAANALFTWITEREKVRLLREQGLPSPWTSDPIIRRYRFCNVRREDDKVTRWIRDNIRKPYDTPEHQEYLPHLLAIARWTNLPSTLESLIVEGFFPQEGIRWIPDFKNMYLHVKSLPSPVFNGAYIIPNAGVSMEKIKFVFSSPLRSLWTYRAILEKKQTLEEYHSFMKDIFAWGPFMAYQVVIDLRFTSLLSEASDAKTFIACGPGTVRGFKRLFGEKRLTVAEKVQQVRDFVVDFCGIELEASDIANCMCELDKYMRGGSKSVYRNPDTGKIEGSYANLRSAEKRGLFSASRGRPRQRGRL